MGKEQKLRRMLQYVVYVVSALFFVFWFLVMLDGFGWAID